MDDEEEKTKVTGKRSSTRGRGRGKGSTRGAKRGSKRSSNTKSVKAKQKIIEDNEIENEEKEVEQENEQIEVNHSPCIASPTLIDKEEEDIESEITSTLSFVSSSRLNVPLHNNKPLLWDHRVNLIGEKCPNPRIHLCDECKQPILIYGRLIPCKHVFCLNCAKVNDANCLRCNEKVTRIEKSGLGTVFMCTNESCRRTYLSQRDLQAHIHHRHMRRSSNPSNILSAAPVISTSAPTAISVSSQSITSTAITCLTSPTNNRSNKVHPSCNSSFQSPIPVVSTRSNLMTVLIQDEIRNVVTGTANSPLTTPQSALSTGAPSVTHFGPQPFLTHPRSHLQWPTLGAFPGAPPFTSQLHAFTGARFENYSNPTAPHWTLPLPHNPHHPAFNRPFFP